MHRRTFLRTSALAVAAAPLGLLAAEAEKKKRAARDAVDLPAFKPSRATPRANKKGFMFSTFRATPGKTQSLREKFQMLKTAGFHGLEIQSGNDQKEVLAARDAAGLEIPSVLLATHWTHPFTDPNPSKRETSVEALKIALRDAKAYGAKSVLVVPAVVNKTTSYTDAWKRSREEIAKCVPLAEELGVAIAIENVWNKFLLGPTELARYVDELASPWVGVHFDAGNLVTFGYPEHWVPILGKRILKVDVKEFVRGRAGGQGFDAKLNEGDTDWPAVVSALKAIGYDGWFTAEMNGGDAAYLKDLGKRMDAFLKA